MIRIAFVKYVGLSHGGTERWLQTLAAHLPADQFAVEYFYADAVPYVGSTQVSPRTDPDRKLWMQERHVPLIEFRLDAIDLTRPTHPWINSNFWELFHQDRYDIVQTAKEGPAEYPFCAMRVPVFEFVAYNGGVDHSKNTVRSIHPSQWQRAWWMGRGGRFDKSLVVPVPVSAPVGDDNLRSQLNIPVEAVVAGFHQRVDDQLFSPVQLSAFQRIAALDRHFVILGGSQRYLDQARELRIPNVHFLEATADGRAISRFLNTLNVMAHGRRDGETFGAVLAEAMRHGVPCVSHRVAAGGNAQHETIGPAGFVVDSVEEYSDALNRLMADSGLRDHLAAKGREHSEQRYSIDSVVEQMVYHYHQFLGRPTVPIPRPPIAYGEVSGGLLMAGDVDDPAHPAHAVLTGITPRGRQAAVLRAILPSVGAVVELGASRPCLALFAARWGEERVPISVIETQPGTCEATLISLVLNNWETRVELIHATDCPTGDSDPGVRDEVTRLTKGATYPLLLSVTEEAAPDIAGNELLSSEVVYVAFELPPSRSTKARLRREGYRLLYGTGFAVHRSAPVSPGIATLQIAAWLAGTRELLKRMARNTRSTVEPVRGRIPARARKAVKGLLGAGAISRRA